MNAISSLTVSVEDKSKKFHVHDIENEAVHDLMELVRKESMKLTDVGRYVLGMALEQHVFDLKSNIFKEVIGQ